MYFRIPFATSGTRTAIPVPTQVDGTVNYTDGYGPDYQLNPDTDPSAIDVERDKMNQLFYDLTSAVQRLQQDAPAWISTGDNGGSSYSYDQGAIVKYTNASFYISLIDANTGEPTVDPTKWAEFFTYYATAAALTAEAATRAAADTTLQANIVAEAATRSADDATLQGNINALPFHTKYTSAPTVFAYNTAVGPFTHSLGGMPFGVLLDLVCVATGDGNYGVGDTIACPGYESYSTEVRGCRYLKTVTTIGLRFGADTMYAPDPVSNARVALTAAKWNIVVSAWR